MIAKHQLTGVVLAGGESRRMGQDKATLVFDGQPLWRRQAEVLRAAGANPVGINRRPDQPPLRLTPGLPLWCDTIGGIGPLAGLHAALHACATDWLAVVAVDLPRLEAGWFLWLATHCAAGRGAIGVHADGLFEPLAAIYPVAARTEVNRRVRGHDFSLQRLAESLINQELIAPVAIPDARRSQLANWNSPAGPGK